MIVVLSNEKKLLGEYKTLLYYKLHACLAEKYKLMEREMPDSMTTLHVDMSIDVTMDVDIRINDLP